MVVTKRGRHVFNMVAYNDDFNYVTSKNVHWKNIGKKYEGNIKIYK